MFCLSCKYIPQSLIFECVESIIKFHPNEKILIADSKSEDKTYLNNLYKYENIEIFLENEDRQIGSLWESYKRYPNEHSYILLQDTVVLKKSLDLYIKTDNLFTTFLYFNDTVGFSCLSSPPLNLDYEFYKMVLSNTDYIVPELGQNIFGSFGPIFIIKNELMQKFNSRGLIQNLKTRNHIEQQYAERLIGICAEQEGYPPSLYNIEGEYYSRFGDIENNNIETFCKIFLMSHNLRLD